VVTRIGFLIWYAVPLAALLTGSVVLGALVFGFYGLVRGAAPIAVLGQLMLRRDCSRKDIARLQEWIFAQNTRAARAADATLLACAVAVVTIFIY
jgi:hypothetical protein